MTCEASASRATKTDSPASICKSRGTPRDRSTSCSKAAGWIRSAGRSAAAIWSVRNIAASVTLSGRSMTMIAGRPALRNCSASAGPPATTTGRPCFANARSMEAVSRPASSIRTTSGFRLPGTGVGWNSAATLPDASTRSATACRSSVLPVPGSPITAIRPPLPSPASTPASAACQAGCVTAWSGRGVAGNSEWLAPSGASTELDADKGGIEDQDTSVIYPIQGKIPIATSIY